MKLFRESQFIDFNRGKVKVSPMDLIRPLPPRAKQPMNLMLMVFECRVDVWQLGPAVEVLKLMDDADDETSAWRHAGYTLLAATFNYFEMVGKILNPTSTRRNSSKLDFNYGFCDVYPRFTLAGTDRSDKALPDVMQFRDRVRNGLYHLGYTKSHVYIHNNPNEAPDDFMIVEQSGEQYYLVNPHALTRTVVAHFPSLMDRLRDPSARFDELRAKFIDFYVSFHQGPTDARLLGTPIRRQ